MNNWQEDLIKTLERHASEDKPSKVVYDDSFFSSLVKYRPTYHFLGDIISAHLKLSSVVDWGCGCGFVLERLKMNGIQDVLGIEGSKEVKAYIPKLITEDIKIADVLTFEPTKKYDLAITMEVAEHLLEKDSARFVNNVCNSSEKYVWWTAATQGQGGTGHVNCKDLCWWISIFKEVGLFEPDWEFTFKLKQKMLVNHQLCLGFYWLRDNFCFLRRK